MSLTLDAAAGTLSAEEEATLQALRRAIVRAQGFSLLLAVCNSPARRDALIERLSQGLPRAIQVTELAAECPDVLESVLRSRAESDDATLAVVRFEAGIRADDFTHPRIAALNQRREEWRDQVRVPVVFWVPEYLLRPLARGAPDFLDWRAGTFLFVEQSTVTEQTRVFRDNLDVWRHTAPERAERIAELRALIERFASGPHRDEQAVLWWKRELAEHLVFSGSGDDVLRLLRDDLLPACRRLNDDRLTAATLDELATVLELRGELDEALRIWREEQLPVCERLGDVRARAVTMGKIADILQARGELDEALRIWREEQLPVFERLGDVHSWAVTMDRIADVLQARGELDEALRIRREELLPVCERLGDVRSRAVTMGKIADVLQARGELDEALRIRREEQLPTFERLGDVRSRAVTMGRIADVHQTRGELDEALRIRREEQLPVYERLGDVRARALTMGKIADVLQARGELDEALRIRREEQLPVCERLGDVRELIVGRANLAITLIERDATGDKEEARRLLSWSLESAAKMGLPESRQIEEVLSRLG